VLKSTLLMCAQVLGQAGNQGNATVVTTRTLAPSSRTPSKSHKAGKKSKTPAAPVPDIHYSSLTDLATPVSSVSAFCQAVLAKVVPDEFWGHGSTQEHNKACFMEKVHHFIHLRRFESMCLHEVMQGMKVGSTIWRSVSS
jgi:telomerase reverse transcriptase